MKLQIETPTHLIDVNHLGLDRIEKTPEGGLRIGYQFAGKKYDVAAFVRNITDDESAVGGIDFNGRPRA